MATITENLEALKQAKSAIKTAIEGKLGENALANVPFIQYANKISEIESGGGGENTGGEVRVTSGEIEVANNMTASIAVEHGLGTTPDVIYWITDDVEGYLESKANGIAGGYWVNIDLPLQKGLRYCFFNITPDFSKNIFVVGVQHHTNSGKYPAANESTFDIWYQNNTYLLKKGKYKWYAAKIF